MKHSSTVKRFLSVLAAGMILLSLCSTAVIPAAAAETDTFAAEVVRLVNAERALAGLPALSANDTLHAAALLRAREESAFSELRHTRPDGRPWHTILEEYNVSCWLRGENLAYGQKSPREVVLAWMNSPGHKVNILGGYTQIGVGVYDRGDRLYWAQLFINHDGSEVAPGPIGLAGSLNSVFGRAWNQIAGLWYNLSPLYRYAF